MPTKKVTKKQNPEVPTGCNGIVVTSVQIYLLKEPMGKTRALARIVLNDAFQLTGLRIVDGSNGLFVSYPNDPSYKGDDYRSLFYPLTGELREQVEEAVLAKYNEALAIQKIGE